MSHDFDSFHIPRVRAESQLPGPGGLPFVELLRRGSLSVELFAPRGVDTQKPHTQDELYIVAQGHGEFVNGPRRHPFGPGDVMFVPAGVVHRFEKFSDDFLVWVVFCGPQGGHIQV
ncbi:MAG TPA: cupin domain-containing protein [Candidatus Krumholzibacteria bacterium]|nr:cupin domain-containing protein [Candidatus Krumholzibacteria bacterium]